MDFRDILGQLHGIIDEGKMADIKGKKHTGKYGTYHDTDEEGEEKKRGGQESDATKDSKKWQGAADAAKLISGGKKASLKDWVESAEESIMERAKNKYAIGMAAAEKMTGDKPPLKKSTIVKAHEIAKGIKEEDVTEARKGDTNFGHTVTKGSWVVHDGSKVKRFKSRDSAKAYAEKNGGKVASSEFYADNIQKQGVDEDMSRAAKGNEKYGKDGMKALAKAGREGASEKKLDTIRDKYDNYDEDLSEELKGGQKKIDKNKNGKLDAQDFKMLRKEKIKEGINFQEMMTEKQRKVDEMLEELQQEIAEFKTTGHMGDKLRDALDIHAYSKDETLIGEEDDAIGDEIRHGQDVQRDKDMARSDARHMQDISDLHDQSTSDLWRMKDLARDKSMSSPSQRPNGQTFPLKSELDENPFSYAAKQAKAHHEDTFSLGGKTFPVKESDEPRLKTTKTDSGSETTSSTGRLKATFEPGKETKVEPIKEAGASGYTDEEMKAMDRATAKAQEANRRETERQYNNVWTDYDHPASPDEGPTGKAPKAKPATSTSTKSGIKESMIYDVWNHQLEKMINESMINESITVSTTQSDQGDDSVSVTASGHDAADILALLRNAGLGGMGPTEHQEEPEQQFSNYGVPISAEHHDAGIANHGKPPVEVISAGDEIGELMQALSSIASEEGSDYADEVEEGNAFTGALHDTPKGGEFEIDGNKYTDNSSLEEEMCQECGVYESGCGCDKSHEMVDEESVEENLESARPVEEEIANGIDNQTTQDIDFMTRVISGGLNKEKVQHKDGYQFADNPLAMKESKVYSANDLLHDYRKLSGLE
jgi:hypothetical protein